MQVDRGAAGVGRPELLFLTGLDHTRVEQVARAMCRYVDTAGVAHNLRAAGRGSVHRWLRRGGTEAVRSSEVDPDQVMRTVCDDLRAVLADLAADARVRRIVVPLDPALEPGPLVRALLGPAGHDTELAARVDVRGVLAVVDGPTWLADATGSAMLAERGFAVGAGDRRTLAQVAVGQVECADAILLAGASDPATSADTSAVLNRLAPRVAHRRIRPEEDAGWLLDDVLDGAGRARLEHDVHGPLLRGEPPLRPDGAVTWMLFSSPLPLHPGRLHDAVPVLLDASVRTRGRIWLPGRPDEVLRLEAAGGGLRVEYAGTWLAGTGEAGWAAVDPQRRAFASLRWHPRFGDRHQEIAVLVHRGEAGEVAAALRSALLTRPELAAGETAWRSWPDPFGAAQIDATQIDAAHVDPCDALPRDLAGTTAPHLLRRRA